MSENKTRERIGTMPCEGQRCASHEKKIPVVVFENDRGTLSYRCDYCSRAKFAKAGTDEHADWMEDITLFEKAAPAAKATPATPAAPAEKAAPAAPEKQKNKLLF